MTTETKKSRKDLQVTFGDITEKNLGQVKMLNSVVFPVRYNDRFYNDLLLSTDFCKLGTSSLLCSLHFSLP